MSGYQASEVQFLVLDAGLLVEVGCNLQYGYKMNSSGVIYDFMGLVRLLEVPIFLWVFFQPPEYCPVVLILSKSTLFWILF